MMIMKFTEFEDELKESMKNNSTNSKRKQIKKKKLKKTQKHLNVLREDFNKLQNENRVFEKRSL
jgi:hypothetical protein